MKQQAKLSDTQNAFETAFDAITRSGLRADENRQELSFEQRIIQACRGLDNGTPLKDYLDHDDVEQAIKMLGDVLTITGVEMPPDWS